MSTVNFLKALGILAVTSASIGCSYAKQADVDALRADVKSISNQASQASADAADARRVAEEANRRSQSTEDALNRSFKKSMRK